MRRFLYILAVVVFSFFTPSAFSYTSVYCASNTTPAFSCFAARAKDPITAQHEAQKRCESKFPTNCTQSEVAGAPDAWCIAIASLQSDRSFYVASSDQTLAAAGENATLACDNRYRASCIVQWSICGQDAIEVGQGEPLPAVVRPQPAQVVQLGSVPNTIAQRLPQSSTRTFDFSLNILDVAAIRTGISFGIGIIIALLIFAKRAAIANLIIHGNLPHTLPVYAEDIGVLFKRTQRVNWYGRVVFGVIARLGMAEKQLALVRRYWLGRVIAFDSLRRQRLNQLAVLHLQFVAKAKSDAHDKKNFWSRRWATLRSLLKKLFWIVMATFGFIMGLFFMRVTIAKLARGKPIESHDLTLILQAKEAIEDTAKYLKEYLETAETFDGRDELYNA